MISIGTGRSKSLAAVLTLSVAAITGAGAAHAEEQHVTLVDGGNAYVLSNYANCLTDASGTRKGYGTAITRRAQSSPSSIPGLNYYLQSAVNSYALENGQWQYRGTVRSGLHPEYASVTSPAHTLAADGAYLNLSTHAFYRGGTTLTLYRIHSLNVSCS